MPIENITLQYKLNVFIKNHPRPRLTLSVILGIVIVFLLPVHLRFVTKALVGWNMTVWAYLIMMWWLMVRVDHAEVIKIAQQEDKRGAIVLTMLSIAAVASLAAIVLELSAAKELAKLGYLHYLFTACTVFGSWCFVGTLFTLHYARKYYQSPVQMRTLTFPNNVQQPIYWDFLYFSFTIAVAAQTSDVTINNTSMRKIVLFQSVLSFIFNAAIISLCINIAASLIN